MESECIFCKIIKGDIPSFKVYEDEMFIAILDRFPASKGHTLIIPKNHHKDIFGLPQSEAEAIYPLAKNLASKIKERFDADGINIVQNNGEAAGQTVDHFHLHIIPRKNKDEIIVNKSTNIDKTIEDLNQDFDRMSK